MLEYAPRGLLGILTPQANTTVEPECGILLPPGYGMITARMTSCKPTIDERLVDYVAAIDTTLTQFANAPVKAVGFACTGAAYLVEPAREAKEVEAISARHGYPFVTASDAIADALSVLGASRIGIVSPYHDSLHDRALPYWAERGLQIAQVARITGKDTAFHPIYALQAGAAKARLGALDLDGLEAVVMLGTGLPTLPTILEQAGASIPVLSPNLCLMWRSILAIDGTAPDREGLLPWLAGAGWGDRLRARMAA